MKFYDIKNKRLILIVKPATPNFWDDHWKIDKTIRKKILNTKKTFVSIITKKFLKPNNGVILEGGCGTGQNVASLINCGYRCIGLDYAEKTVKSINRYISELDIRLGDVRDLPFEDNYFIGYWSLGVIEHFINGYMEIALEMSRVIKKNGYLFLTFPYISPLRKLKARLNMYPIWNSENIENFYQFIFDIKGVINDFKKLGFKVIKKIPYDGIKGFKDEFELFRPILQRMYDYKGKNFFIICLRTFISIFLILFSAHMILIIFQKKF